MAAGVHTYVRKARYIHHGAGCGGGVQAVGGTLVVGGVGDVGLEVLQAQHKVGLLDEEGTGMLDMKELGGGGLVVGRRARGDHGLHSTIGGRELRCRNLEKKHAPQADMDKI